MATKKKVQEAPETIEEKPVKKTAKKTAKPKIEEKPEAVYIYHTGDNISEIAKALTGKSYMEYAILNYSGTNMNELKDGDVLKWGL